MNVRFKKIVMHNFLCFEHEELDLENLGYVIVSGVNNYIIDNAKSNGSGKSSIFNAISYVLTGETLQGLSNNVENIYSNVNDCWAQLILEVDGQEFSIKRIKTPKQDLKIFLNDIDVSGKGIRESSIILKKYLPDLNSTLLGSIIMLGQGLPCKFTDGHPGKRKEKLELLTKSDYMIQLIREKLDTRRQYLCSKLKEHEGLIIANESEKKVYKKQLIDITNELTIIKKYNNIEKSIEELKKTISELNSFIEKNKTEQIQLELDIDNLSQKQLELTKNFNALLSERTENIDSELTNLSIDIQIFKKELQTCLGDVCPTCGQPIPKNMRIDTAEKTKQLRTKEQAYIELCKKENSIKDKLSEEYNKSINDLKNSISQLTKVKAGLKANEAEYLNKLTKEQQNLFKLINLKDSYDKLIASADTINIKISQLDDAINNIQVQIIEDNERLQINTNLISLTKREFRGVLLESVIKYIDLKVKQYSKAVFDTELLSFSLNDNYIDIIYDGKYYEALSGGEQQKVDIIVQLALRDLLNTQLGINCNILVIDEAFDFLDTIGCRKILDLITNLSNIESVFIISHHINELQISYDTEITVVKHNNGVSTIQLH